MREGKLSRLGTRNAFKRHGMSYDRWRVHCEKNNLCLCGEARDRAPLRTCSKCAVASTRSTTKENTREKLKYRAKKRLGICVTPQCNRIAVPGRVRCGVCLEEDVERKEAKRLEWKNERRCQVCGGTLDPKSRSRCTVHLVAQRDYARAARGFKGLAKGICQGEACGVPVGPRVIWCSSCGQKRRRAKRKEQSKNKIKRCGCGRRIVKKGAGRCFACTARSNKASRCACGKRIVGRMETQCYSCREKASQTKPVMCACGKRVKKSGESKCSTCRKVTSNRCECGAMIYTDHDKCYKCRREQARNEAREAIRTCECGARIMTKDDQCHVCRVKRPTRLCGCGKRILRSQHDACCRCRRAKNPLKAPSHAA